jgi:Beta-galactosidase trimerisation domain
VNRFYSELSEVRSTEGWNVTPWCDFRNFMDQTFADAVLRAAAICKAEDPDARCATEGGQSPFPFGWYNYEQVLRADDVIEPYNGGNNVEVIRSLKPSAIMIHTVGYQYTAGTPLTDRDRLIQRRARRPVWWALFHAHRGTLIWDANLPDYQFVDPQSRQFTPAADTYSGVFNEVRAGLGKLFVNAQRTHDGIAIHYSPPSDQIHWLLDNAKYARQWMLHNGSDRGSHAIAVRNSWTKLIEDLGLQYEFVSPGMMKAGKLNTGGYRVFIMPQSIAVGSEEVQRIREFVNEGGLLIADYRAARMNEHGRDLGHGQFDDIFGIGSAKGQNAGETITGVADEGSIHLTGKTLRLRVGDEAVTATTGKVLARSGNVPLIIHNHVGRGRALFLNLEVSDYAYDRLRADSDSSFPELLDIVLGSADVHTRVRVLGSDGKRLPGTEVVIFSNGPVEHVAVFRNPQFDDGGWENHPTMKAPGWAGSIDNSFLEHDAEITIEWSVPRHAYDVRGRRDLGMSGSCKTTLSPWDPVIITLSAQPISTPAVEVAPQVNAGTQLEVKLASEALPGQTVRVVRLEIETPSGQTYQLYERNLLLSGASHTERIPLAHNDPKGRWRVSIRDVMTGQLQQASFEVT